jgi:phosphoribosylformylglycinamidine synthase
LAAAQRRLLHSAHDCSDGGLLVALAEAAIGGAYAQGGLGATLDLEAYAPSVTLEGLLYGEDGARAVVSADSGDLAALLALAAEHGVPSFHAGRVGAADGAVELRAGCRVFRWAIGALRESYFTAIPRRMQHPDVDRAAGE